MLAERGRDARVVNRLWDQQIARVLRADKDDASDADDTARLGMPQAGSIVPDDCYPRHAARASMHEARIRARR
jgi:hypothetical protein